SAIRRRRRPDLLWGRYRGHLSTLGVLYRPHPEGGQSGGPPGAVADQVRAGRQLGDGESARPGDPAGPARQRRRGDRMRRRDALLWLASATAPIFPVYAQAPGKIYRLGVLA